MNHNERCRLHLARKQPAFRMAAKAGEQWFSCYFNNDIEPHAIDDALTLRAMIGQAVR